ncbi:SGNH/GDSL hydrolase family protein [Dyadobacter chenwenxiniae]|uniref:SGNH/GDSL hydrolase family protein n=1 Tax=Dyadobacter chenwenxiniae TaxID=2906456 RepID=A0A9X1PJD6_9BACT|nr:SGNH/GDSL hydrolase family protein [Dyadobacter chenwenxiniae]MCF0061831.1 SGNH/GDSL hydrolase family protein [Dyadobacter chenwenxiniae]UON81646.1 SGNH/GDSL hydrolase family protein [Dyadobacter chenwenxiniae]
MIEGQKTSSHIKNSDNSLSRRRFFYHSGAAIFTTTLLSSCEGVIDDIFPKTDKPEEENAPDRDKTLAFFGDSLTIGAGGTKPYGSVVAAALDGRPVLSDGIVGQVASRIAVRQGGTPLTISIEGDKLNGIKPVKITKLSNQFLSTPTNYDEYSRTGSIGGVRCTIRRTANAELGENYTITPATVSVLDVPADSEFLLDDASRLKTATQILWYGRNNIGKSDAEEQIIAALESSIAYITAPARYIVLGVLLAQSERKGTENYDQVKAINERLAAKYGKSFVEMTPPTDAELAEISYNPSSDDMTDLENLNFPRGLRADVANDEIHLNDKGYQIIANRVIAKIKELKY